VTTEAYIAGTGSFLPGEPIPFDRIDGILGVPEGAPDSIKRWIARTGPVMGELLDIRQFHYAIDPVTREFTEDNVSMSVKAARAALDMAGMDPGEVDLICYGSAHQDQMPTASVRIQEALGIEVCDELSIHANCTSAYKAMYLAHQLIRAGRNRNALVISSNIASSELRAEYYNPAHMDKESLFLRWFLCDGAGAVLLTADPARSAGFEVIQTYIESIGGRRPSHMFNLRPALWMNPRDEYERGLHHLRQRFRNSLATEVFQEPGGSIFLHGFERMLAQIGLTPRDITLFQVNLPTRHISESVREELERVGLSPDAFYTRLDELGYSGPPMVFICLDEIVRGARPGSGAMIASFVTEVSKFMQAGYVLRSHDVA
jgi:3-oxoacyl-[acyl-carrier-protein] synthase III